MSGPSLGVSDRGRVPTVDLTDLTLTEMRDTIARGDCCAADAARACLDHIDTADGDLHAFLQVFREEAIRRAEAVDARISAEGARAVGALAGVPIAIKDNLCLDIGRTTCGSRILERYESPYTATCVQRLLDAGAVVVGKTNLDEFAMGSSTEHSAFGPTRNPWDRERTPGGSSGGSAAAVAARLAPGALGSDTGGSIRQPAAHCGVVGLKPTYGRVSRWGLAAFASSFDQVGPFGRTVEDAALLCEVIAGADPLDSTSAAVEPPDLLSSLHEPIEGLRLGVPAQAGAGDLDPAVRAAFDAACAAYESLGATLVPIDLPHLAFGIAAYYIIAPAEASTNLARYDGIRYGRRATIAPGEGLETLYRRSRGEGFGAEVKRRIMLGTYALSAGYYDAYYKKAQQVRRVIKGDFDHALEENRLHAVFLPTTPGPAFKIGAKTADPLAMYLEDYFTVAANLAGLPGVSFPIGMAHDSGSPLPIGGQLVARAFDEATLLRGARMHEAASDWHTQKPPA